MTAPENNEELTDTTGACQIIINFPGGKDTTILSCDLRFVSPTQIELAGRFLIRQANKFYLMAEMQQPQQPAIQMPPMGFKVDA